MSIENCLRGFCKFVSEFMRLILFFASIVFMMVSVFLFAKSLQGKYTYDTIDLSGADKYFVVILALAVYLIALSIAGIHATFFRSENSMEWFSLLAGVNVLIGLAVLMYVSPRLNDSSMGVDSRLKDLQPEYDWSANLERLQPETDLGNKIDATRKWDIIQSTHQCCGVQSPADWVPFRPNGSLSELPASCCCALDKQMRCLEKNSWPEGCVVQIKAANSGMSLLLTSLIFMNLLLSVLGNLVICCQPKQGYLVF